MNEPEPKLDLKATTEVIRQEKIQRTMGPGKLIGTISVTFLVACLLIGTFAGSLIHNQQIISQNQQVSLAQSRSNVAKLLEQLKKEQTTNNQLLVQLKQLQKEVGQQCSSTT